MQQAAIITIIIAGAILMIINIIRYSSLLKTTQDVISSGSKRDKTWKYLALVSEKSQSWDFFYVIRVCFMLKR